MSTIAGHSLVYSPIDETFPIRDALRSELSWTHYRLLMSVTEPKRREFYLHETIEANWSTRQLERQINSFYYERLLATQKEDQASVRNEIQELEPRTEPDYLFKDLREREQIESSSR